MADDRDDLTQGPVWRALLAITGPMVIGLTAVLSQSLVDTYFVGRLGTGPLAALSFTFPVALSFTSIAVGLSAGAASVVSRAIGRRNGGNDDDTPDSPAALATDAMLLAAAIAVGLAVIGLLTIRPLFGLLGASGDVLDLVVRYMRIWYVSMPFLVVSIVAHGLMRAAGDSVWPSAIMVGLALVNAALTPAMMLGWGPFPTLDIEGVAGATLAARVLGFVATAAVLHWRSGLLCLRLPGWSATASAWWRILKIALPAALGNVTSPVGIAVVTGVLATFGDATVAAFGVATRVESLLCLPMLALSAGVGPVVGQNWGASARDRVLATQRLAFWISLGTAAAITAAVWFGGTWIAAVFASDAAVAAEAAQYLRIVAPSLWGYGAVITAAATFNALGRSVTGLGYYAVRIFALYVPLSWMAAHVWASETAVFVAIGVANALAGLACGAHAWLWLRRATATAPAAAEGDAGGIHDATEGLPTHDSN